MAGSDSNDPSSRSDRSILLHRQNRACHCRPLERQFGAAAQELFAPKASREFHVSRLNRMQGAPYVDCCDLG
jgi:hypothetical protein